MEKLRRLSQTLSHKRDDEEDQGTIEGLKIQYLLKHGFPYQATAFAHDSIQHIVAIGTASGSIKIMGQPGVNIDILCPKPLPITQLLFLVNEGGLISISDGTIVNLWNIRQRTPEISFTLRFPKERITHGYIPFRSKWFYVGTQRGNVYFINLETFQKSPFNIYWNKLAEKSNKSHTGAVVSLVEYPEEDKLLIACDAGLVVLYDLKAREVESRFVCHTGLTSACFTSEFKKIVCSLIDGQVATFKCKNPREACVSVYPHETGGTKDGQEHFLPITKLSLRTTKSGDKIMFFAGGLPPQHDSYSSITIKKAKCLNVIDMGAKILDFIPIQSTPFENEAQDPHSLLVLLHNDLVCIDLASHNNSRFYNPYAMHLGESPVTYIHYIADCPKDLMTALQQVAGNQSHSVTYSKNHWPINGGVMQSTLNPPQELIITGHEDGSLKFWNASTLTLTMLFKFNTRTLFKPLPHNDSTPLAVTYIHLDVVSRHLVIVGESSYVLFCHFSNQESSLLDSMLIKFSNPSLPTSDESIEVLRVRPELVQHVGFQATLFCQVHCDRRDDSIGIEAVSTYLHFNLSAISHKYGICVIDIKSATELLTLSTSNMNSSIFARPRAEESSKLSESIKNESSNKIERCKSLASFNSSVSTEATVNRDSDEMVTCYSWMTHSSTEGPVTILWMGTSSGCIYSMKGIDNQTSRDVAFPEPTSMCLHGSIQSMYFICGNGMLIPMASVPFRAENGMDSPSSKTSVTHESLESTFLVAVSDKECKVFNFPLNSCVHKVRLTETSYVVCSKFFTLHMSYYLACYIANGRVAVYSLPDLRQRVDAEFLSVAELREPFLTNETSNYVYHLCDMAPDECSIKAQRTFCFTDFGQIAYLASPSELQMLTINKDVVSTFTDSKGELFQPIEMPEEASRGGFLKGIFASASSHMINREELFGYSSPRNSSQMKPSKVTAAGASNTYSKSAAAEAMRAKIALHERGEKLSSVEDRTAEMRNEAKKFSKMAEELSQKYNKKWYQI